AVDDDRAASGSADEHHPRLHTGEGEPTARSELDFGRLHDDRKPSGSPSLVHTGLLIGAPAGSGCVLSSTWSRHEADLVVADRSPVTGFSSFRPVMSCPMPLSARHSGHDGGAVDHGAFSRSGNTRSETMTQAPRTLSDMPTVPFADSSDLLEDPGALRARAEEHGYLFFRGLLPAEAVLDVRRRFLRILERHGWLDPNDPTSGRVNLAAFEREERSKVEFCGV